MNQAKKNINVINNSTFVRTASSTGASPGYRTILMIFIVFIILALVPNRAMADQLLPQTLGSFKLVQSVTGDQAKRQIGRMHGKAIAFKQAAIGAYRFDNHKATLWISAYEKDHMAIDQIGRMSKRIKSGKGEIFTGLKMLTLKGLPIYFVKGMGQDHYFFQKNNLAVWLAVGKAFSLATAKQAASVIE